MGEGSNRGSIESDIPPVRMLAKVGVPVRFLTKRKIRSDKAPAGDEASLNPNAGCGVAVPAGDDTIILAKDIVKSFGTNIAVDGLSLSIKRGEVYGFLGPNGAGKTTTVNILTTADLPDSAELYIDGVDALSNRVAARSDIGIVQQQNSLEKEISVRENIVHHGLMQNMSRKQIEARMEVLCERMQLTGRLDSLVRDLSGGWKRRVAIVCSLIHNPKILFLDEPATGLDTQSRNLLYSMVKAINAEGTTIFFTTHYIYEAEDLCHRIGIINEGKLVAEGTPDELQSMVPPSALVVTFEDGREEVSYHENHEAAQRAALEIEGATSIAVRQSNLEDVFLELTGRSL